MLVLWWCSGCNPGPGRAAPHLSQARAVRAGILQAVNMEGIVGAGGHSQGVLRVDQQVELQGLAPVDAHMVDVERGPL